MRIRGGIIGGWSRVGFMDGSGGCGRCGSVLFRRVVGLVGLGYVAVRRRWASGPTVVLLMCVVISGDCGVVYGVAGSAVWRRRYLFAADGGGVLGDGGGRGRGRGWVRGGFCGGGDCAGDWAVVHVAWRLDWAAGRWGCFYPDGGGEWWN